MPLLNSLTGAFAPGVLELDGVHGGRRSEVPGDVTLQSIQQGERLAAMVM